MSDLRVKRAPRPVCPFCKEEVAAGHVWVCSSCEAAHHAECEQEHGACASCGFREAGAARRRAEPVALDRPRREGPEIGSSEWGWLIAILLLTVGFLAVLVLGAVVTG